MARAPLLGRLLSTWLALLVLLVAPMLVVAFGVHGINRRDVLLAVFVSLVLAAFVLEAEPLVKRRLKAFWKRHQG
jgi:cytosine/uracil/thiamine/allantoin permease